MLAAGIFVGGASSRMGGAPKGLLRLDDGRTLIDRWCDVLATVGAGPIALVGRRPEYAAVELVQLADDPAGIGPLGGLRALLRWAGDRRVFALGCDMPFVDADDLRALAACDAIAAAAWREDRWEPLCAIFTAPRALPIVDHAIADGVRSLAAVLDRLGAAQVALDPAHLHDWDRPSDRA